MSLCEAVVDDRNGGMSEHVRCAIIGSGFAGSTYAEAIRYAADADLVAIAGGHQAPELAARHGIAAVSDVDALLDSADVDAVLIASPNPFHCPQALRAAASGKHVLVEKPMAMSVADGQRMLEACRKAGVVLMVGHHHRFRRNPLAVKLLLERGRIGRVDMVAMVQTEPDQTTWLTKPENGGYLLGSGIHGLDLLRWWLGDVSRVAALTGQYRGERVENGSLLLLDFVSGTHASFQDSVIPGSVPPSGSGVVRFDAVLTGAQGVLYADMYGEVRVSTPGGWEVQTMLPRWDGHYAFLRMEAYASQAREFVAAIKEHRSPQVAPEDGLAALAIVEAAHQAAAAGSWVSVAPAGPA
jgi:predicted dehydrogenase